MQRNRATQLVDGSADRMIKLGTLLWLERDVIAVCTQLVKPLLPRILMGPGIGAELAGSK